MPVYGNANETEPIQLSRGLPPEKRIELYDFHFENDENEVPAKKIKKRKPREKKKGTKFFENIGKNVLPPKPKKVPKKCVEEVTKRVLPRRGALRQILPVENIQSTSVLSTKNAGQLTSHPMTLKESSCPVSNSVSSFEGVSFSKNPDESTNSNLTATPFKQSSTNSFSSHSNSLNSLNQEVSKSKPLTRGTLLHRISFNDFNDSGSIVSDKSSREQTPIDNNFKIPASITVRNLRNRSRKANLPQCSSPKPSKIIRCSSPKSTKHVRCSSLNNSKSPDRTLLFGATSPIKRQSASSESLSSVGNENTSFNNLIHSNVKSFNSSVKSFGNETCFIAGNLDDTYKSTGEEDLCHYFGFEEEDEEELCSKAAKTVPKKVTRKKAKVEAAQCKEPEKPPVDEILSLLKSSVPADSNLPEYDPEPFSLSSHIWSPVKTEGCPETNEDMKKPLVKMKGRPRTKIAHEKLAVIDSDDEEEPETQAQVSRKDSKYCRERKEVKEKTEDATVLSDKELNPNKRCRTKPKMTESRKNDKADECAEEGRKMNNVYRAPKKGKEATKHVKDKKEAGGNKEEMDEFEALAASLNAQLQEVENFKLAVE